MNTTTSLRKKNLLEILKVIRTNQLITRPDIAKKTKLTKVTVSTLIAELVDRNIVIEEGHADSKGGRKAVVYRFNNNAYNIIGVNISLEKISINMYDLSGKCIFEGEAATSHKDQTVEETVSIISKNVHKLLETTGVDKEEIIGMGVLVPGRVDFGAGIVRYLPNIKNWINIPLKSILEGELGIPTMIERDTNGSILYLKHQGLTGGLDNVVYASIHVGIGTGVQIDGEVYHGDHGLAGETGHTIIMPDGPLCSCGNYGCVESLSSHAAIARYYTEAIEVKGLKGSAPLKTIEEMAEPDWIDALAANANNGDEAADYAFSHATQYLCIYVHNLITTYDPGQIILECKWMKIARKYYNQLVSNIFDFHSIMDRTDVKITLNPLYDFFTDASSAVIIENFMQNIDRNWLISKK